MDSDIEMVKLINDVAFVLHTQKQYAEAEALEKRAIDIRFQYKGDG